ncbi:MAG: PAS domain S-box protein [Armatimonadota bacterium]
MRSNSTTKKRGWRLVVAFAVLSLGIAAAARAYYLAQKANLSRSVRYQLASIADLKVRQIARWREDQIDDACAVASNTFAAAYVARYLANPSDRRLRSEVTAWMRSLLASGERSAVLLLDASSRIRLAVPNSAGRFGSNLRKMVKTAIASGAVGIGNLHTAQSTWGRRPHLDLVAPLKTANDRRPVAVLAWRIDASKSLYPLIQSWPTPSRTAETLLVRRDGDHVLFLNELRHRKGTALQLRRPIRGDSIPAVLAVLGREGVVEGCRDYRGVPVVAVVRSVPGTTWKLVAKVDEEEAFGELHRVAVLASVVVGLLVLGAGLATGLLWQKQIADYEAAQARERLQQEALRNHYNYLMHRGHDSILLLDENMTVINANERAAEWHGVHLDDLLGTNLDGLRSRAGVPSLGSRLRTLDVDAGTVFEIEHPRPDGGSFSVEVSARCTQVGDQRYYQIIARDITERKQAEAERARLSAAVEQARDATVVQDADWNVQYVNAAFIQMTGLPADEVLGRKLTDRFPEGPAREAYRQALITAQHGDIWEGQLVLPSRDGAERHCYVVVSPVRDPSGHITNLVSVLRDITREILVEEHLRQAQKLDAVGRLAGGVAHEFNNLMTAVIGFSRLLASHVTSDPTLSRYTQQITKAAERAAELTRQLLAFSQKQIIQPRVLRLGELVVGMHGVLQRILGENITLLSTSAPDVWSVKADPALIQEIIVNLAANARDAMPNGGKLTIEVANSILDDAYASRHPDVVPGPYVVISITDTGHGMDRETLEHLFEPFYTTKGLATASGLGLASVYGMVKQSGGHISVYSEVGRGTTFRVYLPRSKEDIPAPEILVQDAEPGRGETILVVEDDEMVRNLVVDVLGSYGYSVLSAGTPDDALEACRANPGAVDLLLADVALPGMSGRALADRLGELKSDIRVLYMSGYPEGAAVHSGHVDTSGHYLSKPFTAQALLKKVREVLDELRAQ